MKTLNNLEKYIIQPNVAFYGGYIWDGDDIELCDDVDTSEGYRFEVKQVIRDGVLLTDIVRVYERRNGKMVTESSHMEVELEENQLLCYAQGQGFIIPEYKMMTVDEAIRHISILKGEEE